MNDADGAAQDRERVTVTLTAQAETALAALQARTRLSKTDIANRGITLYGLIDGHMAAGAEVLIRYPDGTERLVAFL